MQIVIDIPDFIYNALKEDVDCGTVNLNQAIVNGTVLPKGHGRLIDADTLATRCGRCDIDCAGDCDRCSDNVVSVEDIRRASTVIDADKEVG